MTMFDVAAAGVMLDSVAGHGAAVRRWATCVWDAWSDQHPAVTTLTDEILRTV